MLGKFDLAADILHDIVAVQTITIGIKIIFAFSTLVAFDRQHRGAHGVRIGLASLVDGHCQQMHAVKGPGGLVIGCNLHHRAVGVGKGLGVVGNVSSPTFVIARTHKRENSEIPLVHVDAYRLSSPSELDDLDIPFTKAIVLVEWGKGLTEGIADNWLEIAIARDTTGESEVRTVQITGFGPRWQQVEI